MTSPLELLSRRDKWYLSAGEGLIFAPPFPQWLDHPGFWDEAHLFEYPTGPLFTVGFVDDGGREIPLRPGERRWTPAALEVPYSSATGLEFSEARMILPGFVAGSEWQILNLGTSASRVHAIAWACAPGEELGEDDVVFQDDSQLVWSRSLTDRKSHTLMVRHELAIARGADSWAAHRSEPAAVHPLLRLTPFWDRWDPTRAGLRNQPLQAGISRRGIVYLGIHRMLEIPPGGTARLAVALRLVPALTESASRTASTPARRASSFSQASRDCWEEYFASVPTLNCSDPYFERYWAYRWYGLRLNGVAPGWGNYVAPTVTEGIAYFHQPISYSAQCHVRELRWARDPAWARGVVRTFLAHQLPSGALHGRIYANHFDGTDFYHADWGGALMALDDVHPDDAFLSEVLPRLSRYAEWLLATRDPGLTGMIDVTDQYETGQEYMSRYQAVDPDADRYGWENRIRLKGVDVTVYAYRLFQALARLGPRVGLDPGPWHESAARTRSALLLGMWDEKRGMFSDVNPATGRRTQVSAAVCFYPYFTDCVGAPHLQGMVSNLFDPRQFWKPFPVTSSSGTDPLYDPDAAWKGKRHNCPWNGRVWPMTNSHVAEAIATVALEHLPALRAHLVEFLTKFVRMMFWDGDSARPNCFEHYHPVTGRPSAYRGIDDYQHSWVNDLMVQYLVGLRAAPGGFVVDPFPFPVEFEARGLPMRGAIVDVVRSGDHVVVSVGGAEAARGRIGKAIRVAL
ncbi:MAG TPA: hypothetical protein VNL98_01580 [Gemmatimonadales bacterium]|nr:hypothetical protein [Gemmatimonadales bacterium]